MAILGTQSLTQLVRVRPEASGTVEARQAFRDAEIGSKLQSGFFPLSPQIDALRAAAETARDGGSILLAGAAGTGKSMLLFMLGKALSARFPGDDFTAVCDRIKDAQAVKALAGLRSSGRRWLVMFAQAGEKDDFDTAVRRALNGALHTEAVTDFAPTPGQLRDEFAQTVEALKKQGGFDGIAVLFDGVDDLVSDVLEEKESKVAGQVRDFADFCRSSKFPVLLAAVVDREMGLFTLEEETRLLELFGRVQPVTLLGKTGEWEELVGRVILEHPQDDTWTSVKAHQDLRTVRETASRLGLYQGQSERWLNEVVVEGAYPMHPAALFALPRVALRLSSQGKTAFTFFSDAAPGGLLYFLNNFAVTQPNGRLSLYTADSLFTHFEKAIEEDPVNADFLQALQKAVLSAGDIPQARRILRMVLIIQMVGHDRLRARADDLIWALHLGEREVRIARRSLDLLVQKGALRYSEGTEEFLLPLERPQVSLEDSLARTRNRVRTELDVTTALQRQFSLPRFEAKRFNSKHGTDRTAFGRLFRASDLRDPDSFRQTVDESVGQVRPYKGDLMVAYVLAETAEDLKAVRRLADDNLLDHPRLVLALPNEARPFTQEALEAVALERMRALEPPFSDPTSAEHGRVTELLEEARGALRASFKTFLDPENLEFRYDGETLKDLDEGSLQDYVDSRVGALLGAPPPVSEPALAYLRDPGSARRQRQAALNYLLSCRGELALRQDSGPVGRILKAGLIDTGILHVTRRVGSWTHYGLAEEIPDRGLGKAFLFLTDRLLGESGEEKITEAASVVLPLLQAPYSLTPAMVELLLATVLWKWPAEFDLCRNWQRAEAESRMDLLEEAAATAESLFELAGAPGDWAIKFADAEAPQREYLVGLLEAVGSRPSASEDSLWRDAGHRLLEWYDELPAAARVAGAARGREAEAVLALFSDRDARRDLRELLEARMPRALGAGNIFSWSAEGEEFVERFVRAREALETVVSGRRDRLVQGLKDIFAAHAGGDEAAEWPERARRWLESVSDDVAAHGAPKEYEAVADAAHGHGDPGRRAEELAEALGCPSMGDWSSDHTEEILERIQSMREEVEWGVYREAFAADIPDPEEAVLTLVRPVLTRAGLPADELEGLLVAELELAAWPDFVYEPLPEPEPVRVAAPEALPEPEPEPEAPAPRVEEPVAEEPVAEEPVAEEPPAPPEAPAAPLAEEPEEVGVAAEARGQLPDDEDSEPTLQWL